MSFDLSKFRNEFLQSDGWKVSDCYKPYEDKFLRKDAQDAYEGAKWGFEAGASSRQAEIDELQKRIYEALEAMDAESIESWGLWKEKADMYDQGASDAYEKSYWILKGNKND